MTTLKLKKMMFYLGVVFLSCLLYSPFLADLLVDWSNPVSITRVQKPTNKYQNELKDWQKRRAEAKKEKTKFGEAEPAKDSIEVKWDIHEYSFYTKPAYLCKKLGIPLAPNLLWLWPAYFVLACSWLYFFIKSGLYFHSNGYKALYPWIIAKGAVIAFVFVSGIILHYRTVITSAISAPDLRQAAQAAMDQQTVGIILSAFPMFIMLLPCDVLMMSLRRLPSNLAKKSLPFIRTLISPFLGSEIRLKKNGKVVMRNLSLEANGDRPKLRLTNYRLSLPEFLHYSRSLLLGNVSSRLVKQCQDEIIGQLRRKFNDACRRMQDLPSGDAIPRNLRFLIRKGDKTIAVIQDPPAVREIHFAPMVLEKEKSVLKAGGALSRVPEDLLAKTSLKLAFPYCLFLVVLHKGQFESLWAYWSPRSLDSVRQNVYLFSFYNIRLDGNVCLGRSDRKQFRSTLAQICDSVIDEFWEGYFSFHHDDTRDKLRRNNPSLETLYHWHQTSLGNPDFVYGINMDKALLKADDEFRRKFDYLSERIDNLTEDEKDANDKIFDEFVDDVLSGKPLPIKVLDSKVELTADVNQLFEAIKAAKEARS